MENEDLQKLLPNEINAVLTKMSKFFPELGGILLENPEKKQCSCISCKNIPRINFLGT